MNIDSARYFYRLITVECLELYDLMRMIILLFIEGTRQ